MTLIEPIILGGATIGSIVGAVWGFVSSGVLWGLGGFVLGGVAGGVLGPFVFLALGLFVVGVLKGPRHVLRLFRPEDPQSPGPKSP
ncbi:hypothetical protein LZ198_24130 [Myxococcus sp. K15C18031901]|uniref:hypothetical protein n=1 Tax=Myxococcus dinghuensis TaxID=2906761 RepID=UPI0020A70E20|nr:hypothetical protein [Myxococcus dinghuensis]MCP3101959.1 hypothetical protein [Myxococcus dinghuensis]